MKQKINCRPVDILERKLKYLPFSLCCIFSLKAYKQMQGFFVFLFNISRNLSVSFCLLLIFLTMPLYPTFGLDLLPGFSLVWEQLKTNVKRA